MNEQRTASRLWLIIVAPLSLVTGAVLFGAGQPAPAPPLDVVPIPGGGALLYVMADGLACTITPDGKVHAVSMETGPDTLVSLNLRDNKRSVVQQRQPDGTWKMIQQ
ncbi:MAG: hypothetical protein IT436_18935 [Phycisphaerales bacterium]|nr:hypothetical protein [Phycisphaerales bacterium]